VRIYGQSRPETGTDNNGQQTVQMMQPNYVLMKLPGGTGEEFVEILPFTPANRIIWLGGLLVVAMAQNMAERWSTTFRRQDVIDGPQQIEARIDQNAQLSGQLTLWNQQGSHVSAWEPSGHSVWAGALVCRTDLSSGSATALCRSCAWLYLLCRTGLHTAPRSRQH